MNEAHAAMDVVRKGGWAGALVLATTLAATSVFTSRQTPVYRSSGMAVVKPAPSLVETADVLRSLEALERRTILATFSELAASTRVKDAAAQRAGLTPAYAAAFQVATSILPNTNIIRISVEGPDPQLVALVARHVTAVLATEGQRLYSPFLLEPLSEAVPAARPAFPDPRRNTVVGLVVGLFLGTLVTFGWARFGHVRGRIAIASVERAHVAR